MGVVDFDPENWRQANATEAPAGVAKVAKIAEVDSGWTKLSQLSQLSQADPLLLPPAVADGLTLLRSMRAPRLAQPDRWPVAASDALRLASDGWAAKAIALGWSQLDLFGAVPAPDGDPDADGLAVKLGGRTVLAICASFATVSSSGVARTYLHRGNNAGAVLMWALSRGR